MQKNNFGQGLSDIEVLDSRKKHGNNLLSPAPKVSSWKLFLRKFEDPIVRILIIAAFLSLLIAFLEKASIGHGNFAEPIGIFIAVLLATGVSFWFEEDANREFELLNKVNDDVMVKVIRNGQISEVAKTNIVVNDIVIIEAGEEVPADGILIESTSLQVDESCLTGELLIDKTADENHFDKNATYASNEVLRGTKVLNGHGIIKIIRVGDQTEYGKLATKSTEIVTENTPLNRQLERLAKLIGLIGLILAVIIFAVLFVKDIISNHDDYSGQQILIIIVILVSLAVALIKVWLPILYSGFELLGKEKAVPHFISQKEWYWWASYGIIVFLILSGFCFLGGVNPIDSKSWIGIAPAQRILQFFMISVTLIVVAVPEGLPMSITLSLALSMRRMLKTKNLVRKMHACETMGAATVICTDKTGTLTQNRMTVADTKFPSLNGHNLDPKLQQTQSLIIAQGIAVNSTAHIQISTNKEKSDEENLSVIGNPTESALLLWLHSQNIDYLSLRKHANIIVQLPFSTERKFMATLIELDDSNDDLKQESKRMLLYVKGAPEIILSLSSNILLEEKTANIDEYKKNIQNELLQYQEKAMRTLGFAYKYIELPNIDGIDAAELSILANDMTFVGIVAISDPIRPEVPQSISECMQAGIKIKIITGDTSITAKEIARQIGVWQNTDNDNQIITGIEFENLTDKEALERIKELKIMCRARPTDKQRLVQLLQQQGEIVAVTGDGTNDAPALNYANIGLSMGTGTSVAKEASDITLLDDSFASIITAVVWGRSLYLNIQRFILFQLVISVTAMILVFLGALLGFELPLTVTQMLWLNLIMDTFAAGALATIPPDKSVLKEKPRKNSDFIITKSMSHLIFSTSSLFVVLLLALLLLLQDSNLSSSIFSNIYANDIEYGMSFFFTFFVFLQFWNLFNAKAFKTSQSAFYNLSKNKSFIIVLLIILCGQFIIVTFGGEAFRTVPLRMSDWCIILGITSVVLWVGEIFRWIKRFKKQREHI